MIRLGSKGLKTMICSALVGISLGACADTETSLFVYGNIARIPPNCDVSWDTGSPMLGRGLMDVAFTQQYVAALLVGNQLTSRGSKQQLRPETMRVYLQGAEITLTDLAGAVIEEAFSVPGAGFADVSTGPSPGYGGIFVDLIPAAVGNRLATQLRGSGIGSSRTVIAEVRVFGTAIGGQEMESGPFSFPIDVCYGCAVDFPLEAITVDPATGEAFCGAQAEGLVFEYCGPAPQDVIVDCRACVIDAPDVCSSPE